MIPLPSNTNHIGDDYALALALAEDPVRTSAIIRSAFRWGYGRGWLHGYDRTFAERIWQYKAPLEEIERGRAKALAEFDTTAWSLQVQAADARHQAITLRRATDGSDALVRLAEDLEERAKRLEAELAVHRTEPPGQVGAA